MLLDQRRLLDGGNEDGTILGGVSDFFAGLRDSVETAVGGVLPDDIASGAVDPVNLSRPQKAALAIDGEVPGFFDLPNPWAVGLDFSESVSAAALVNGGLVLVVSCNAGVFDTAQGAVFSPRFALLWDDQVVEQSGVLKLDFTSQTILVAQIGPPRGARLTLWCTDPDITFVLMRQEAPNKADEVRKEVFGAVGAAAADDGDLIKGVKAFFGQVFDLQKEAVFVAAIVAGVVIYFLAKGELTAMRGGGGG